MQVLVRTVCVLQCSVACGGGVRHRVLMCFVNGSKATPGECDSNARPESTEDCNQQPCDEGKTMQRPSLGMCHFTDTLCYLKSRFNSFEYFQCIMSFLFDWFSVAYFCLYYRNFQNNSFGQLSLSLTNASCRRR